MKTNTKNKNTHFGFIKYFLIFLILLSFMAIFLISYILKNYIWFSSLLNVFLLRHIPKFFQFF